LLGRVGWSVYSAPMAALMGFTRSRALELAPAGVTVNCVAPGPVATETFRREPLVPDHRSGDGDRIPQNSKETQHVQNYPADSSCAEHRCNAAPAGRTPVRAAGGRCLCHRGERADGVCLGSR
ncbi:MAG: SDR family NAD(P)-dependent oxidoreductase, partial [Ideonella sp.]